MIDNQSQAGWGGMVFTRNVGETSWTNIAGALVSASLQPGGIIQGVNAQDQVWWKQGTNAPWVQMPGGCQHMTCGPGNDCWCNASDTSCWHWFDSNPGDNKWTRDDQCLTFNISVSNSGAHVFGIGVDHCVWWRNGVTGVWTKDGCYDFTQMSSGLNGVMIGCKADNTCAVRNYDGTWTDLAKPMKAMCINEAHDMVGVDTDGKAWTNIPGMALRGRRLHK